MPSLAAHALALLIRLTGGRRKFARADVTPREFLGPDPKPALPPRALRRRLDVGQTLQDGHAVYTVMPRGRAPSCTVIYFHGGAYAAPITRIHWWFVARLAERLGVRVVVPLYPLAPAHTCAETIPFALALYRNLVAGDSMGRVIVMGDSAGGGLALALAQQAVAAGLPAPGGLVLISPWLDVTLSDPEQAAIEPRDVMLMRPGARAAGLWYAGALPVTDPRVSPLFGSFAGVPPILMFCGGHDILVTDARRLAARTGCEVIYHEEPGLMHVYPILSVLPEARAAQDWIAGFVERVLWD
ncbi:hypothetical protein ASF22_12685 [Methylobacterium sp. Leaf87]|uniref:alpha/beta hydrolase n=1 Tax=Methylobacterium sp. Leaf87 TaxID=1736243 RepID=UPI0006FF7ADC|nr:alpha/beta hydrolase [Methylobacterium sp. Leaf87]KQO72584.1 hypothetical protein ASF22_12685 [Methylobacterium sp. Leaf87]